LRAALTGQFVVKDLLITGAEFAGRSNENSYLLKDWRGICRGALPGKLRLSSSILALVGIATGDGNGPARYPFVFARRCAEREPPQCPISRPRTSPPEDGAGNPMRDHSVRLANPAHPPANQGGSKYVVLIRVS